MSNQVITVNYGADSHRVYVDSENTIHQIIANPTTKAILGYGDNVKALVYGVEQSGDTKIGSVTELTLETKANSKA